MWHKCANTLAPLKKLCSIKVKFKWTGVENNYFLDMKNMVGRDVLLSYTTFSKTLMIHTDASKTQLDGVISQNG